MPRFKAGEIFWELFSDSSGVQKDLKKTDAQIKGTESQFSKFGKTIGSIVSAGALIAIGKQALQTGINFNKGLANVGSLIPGQVSRLEELKEATKNLALDTGGDLNDLANGLYNVVSAYGDTDDTVKQLDITVKAAKAGVSSTTDALNLLSAVTKAYSDTSAEAQQRVSDFAFETVRLGQTTFPELASSIQLVTDRSQALDVSQEELFTTFATLTGVTGNAARVSTQLRSALVALDSPTDTLIALYDKLGVESGKALIQQEGLQGAFELIKKDSEETGTSLNDYLGRVEAVTAVSTIAGSQAETFASKLLEISDASGATQKAFEAQTEGINKSGFALETLNTTFSVFQSELTDIFEPAVKLVAEGLTNLINVFRDLPDSVQAVIVGLVGTAGIAPAIIKVASILGSTLLPLLLSPAGIIIALGALTASLVAAGIESQTFEGQLKKQAEALDNINKLIDDANALKTQADEARNLLKEYDQLNSKTQRTEKEQTRLNDVIKKIGEDLPGAATSWNEYGEAVELNTDKANEAIDQLLRSRKSLLEASKASLEAQAVQAEQTKAEIRDDLAEARRVRDEATQALRDSQEASAEAIRLQTELDFAKQTRDTDFYNQAILDAIDSLEALNEITAQEAEEFRQLGINTNFVEGEITGLINRSERLADAQEKAIDKAIDLEETWEEAERVGLDLAKTQAELEEIYNQLGESADNASESQDNLNKSTDEGGKSANKAIPEWRKLLAEILNIEVLTEGSGAKFVDNFLAGFERQRGALQQVAEQTGDALDLSGILEEERDLIESALQELLSLPGEVFTVNDTSIQGLIARLNQLNTTIDQLKENNDELAEKKAFDENAVQLADEYQLKLEQLNETELEAIERERELALEKVIGNQAGIDAVNAYYDVLKDDTATEIAKENLRGVLSVGGQIYNSLKDIVGQYYENEIELAEGNESETKALRKKQFETQKAFSAIETGIAGAQAAIQAFNSLAGIPVVGPALGTAAAVAVGVLTAAKVGFILSQQAPSFQNGGIVPGSQLRGDQVPANLNSREAVLTLEDQQLLFDAIRNGGLGGGVQRLVINLVVDGDQFTQVVVDKINNREYTIRQGSIET